MLFCLHFISIYPETAFPKTLQAEYVSPFMQAVSADIPFNM